MEEQSSECSTHNAPKESTTPSMPLMSFASTPIAMEASPAMPMLISEHGHGESDKDRRKENSHSLRLRRYVADVSTNKSAEAWHHSDRRRS